MIDLNSSESDATADHSQQGQTPTEASPSAVEDRSGVGDLFEDIFTEGEQPSGTGSEAASAATASNACIGSGTIEPPSAPTTLAESGLTLIQVSDLILKQLYVQGNILGSHLARESRLPFPIIEGALQFLKDEKCTEVASGDLIGPASYRFNLTELGRNRAREAFEQCRYVGPAPVPLEDYVIQCRRQGVSETTCTPQALQDAFSELIIRPDLLEELGPAVCSGKSIFLYGPPGNGKTMIAKGLGEFLNANGGEIYVPYAIKAENSIITVFDPTMHQSVDATDQESGLPLGSDSPLADLVRNSESTGIDQRWRRIRRPVVITGGELTLDMLDLRYNTDSNLYMAPLHIKANCGVFLIDDFGRQMVSPRDLLNRWIVPLEERVDYLTLATGKKFSVPFEQLTIFSTNLDPGELVDEAFLRRIRHKIEITAPSREQYSEIFQRVCQKNGISFDTASVDYLFSQYYEQGRPVRSSDPRDFLEIVQAICRFKDQQVLLTPELLEKAAQRFFRQVVMD